MSLTRPRQAPVLLTTDLPPAPEAVPAPEAPAAAPAADPSQPLPPRDAGVRLHETVLAQGLLAQAKEHRKVLFEATWSEDDPKAPGAKRRLVSFVVEEGTTKVLYREKKQKRTKHGMIEVDEDRLVPLATRPIIPAFLVRTLNSEGRETGRRYEVYVDAPSPDKRTLLPFGQGKANIEKLQRTLEYADVSISDEATRVLASVLDRIMNLKALSNGKRFLAEAVQAGIHVGSRASASDQAWQLSMSTDGVVLLDPEAEYADIQESYAYAEPGWSTEWDTDEAGNKVEIKKVHVVEGDPRYAGQTTFEHGRGAYTSVAGSFEGWRDNLRAVLPHSPLFGVLVAHALGSYARGLLNITSDVSGLIYLYGPTSRGKSWSQRGCASIMGHPDVNSSSTPSPMVRMDRTEMSFDKIAAGLRHGFMLIDELQQGQKKELDRLAALLMKLANGSGRGRTRSGGEYLQDSINWDLTTMMSANDGIEETALRALGADAPKFMEAIMARLVTIDIEQFPIFPEALWPEAVKKGEVELKTWLDQRLLTFKQNRGTVYRMACGFLGSPDNQAEALRVFHTAEAAFLKANPAEGGRAGAQRSSRIAAFYAIGTWLMREVLGFTEAELAPMDATWTSIAAANSRARRASVQVDDLKNEIRDLVDAMDAAEALAIQGYIALNTDDLGDGKRQVANAARRSTAQPFVAYLDQPQVQKIAGHLSGKLYLAPTGSAMWAARREWSSDLRDTVDRVVGLAKQAHALRLTPDGKTSVPKQLKGTATKNRYHEIDLDLVFAQPDVDGEEPTTEAAPQPAPPAVAPAVAPPPVAPAAPVLVYHDTDEDLFSVGLDDCAQAAGFTPNPDDEEEGDR